MSFPSSKLIRAALVLAAGTMAFAQDPSQAPPPNDPTLQQGPARNGGWRRADDLPPADNSGQLQDRTEPAPPPSYAQNDNRDQFGAPVRGGQPPQGGSFGQPPQGRSFGQPPAPPAATPTQLTLKPGTFVTVRVDQPLSSDHNQPGDAFAATLVKPLIVDGVVVAQSGQTIAGRVAEAKKAGRVSGTSRLGVQLTELTLVDGQQLPIQSQLVSRTGPTSVGRDAAAIAGTTGLGAAVGAAADWGRGAAIGAGAGAAVGIIGVLLTRGQPTIIFPEQVLTFRVEAPVAINTSRAPDAFRYADARDYGQQYGAQGPPPGRPYGPGAGYYGGGPVAYSPYPYPYRYYYGPAVGFYYGPGFFYRGYYGGFRHFHR
jgi:hypothetical protein